MIPPPPFIDELQQRAQRFVDTSPLKDFEKNARTWLDGAFAHFNLVQQSEVSALHAVLEKMAERIGQLEKRINDLENRPH